MAVEQRIFKLTSPPITSDHVAAFQRALTAKRFYHGKIDGICGELTVQGFYRAKYWLGYKKPDHTGSDLLYSYLTNQKQPTQEMKHRTQSRLKLAKARQNMRAKIMAEARKHIGEKERTGNNDIFYSDWWGVHGPWCAMFTSFCCIKAGSKVFTRGHNYAFVPSIVRDARSGFNSLTVTWEPVMSDLVCYDWQKDKIADHVEFFEAWIDRSHGVFSTVGGNTSGDDSGSQSNGGMVCHRKAHPRFIRDVQAFVHVGK